MSPDHACFNYFAFAQLCPARRAHSVFRPHFRFQSGAYRTGWPERHWQIHTAGPGPGGRPAPSAGKIAGNAKPGVLRQDFADSSAETLADLFAVSAALANLRRAEAGEADAWAAADWAPEARLAEALGRAGLEAAPETPLAAIIFAEADFPLLDEPANHLDIASPEAVGAGLAACDGAPLVVSHDEAFQERAGLARRIQLRSGPPTGS